MLSKRIAIFLMLVAALLATSSALGQSTPQSRAPSPIQRARCCPNATVVVKNRNTSTERTTQTDSDGNYQVAALPVGLYSIEVRVQGFKTQVADQVTLEVAKTVVQNFQMDVGAISEQVLVSSDVPVIETATTSVGTVINQRTVQEIPLNGRHFVDLGLLIPGSVTPPQNGFLTAPLRGQGSFAINTAGKPRRYRELHDQTASISTTWSRTRSRFSRQSTRFRSLRLTTRPFSAEYGRNSGAIVNIATRSGTNDYHGELFEFLRNDYFDARNFFDRTSEPLRSNETSLDFNLGGPLNLLHFRRRRSDFWLQGPEQNVLLLQL
jgi:hypothetical protein